MATKQRRPKPFPHRCPECGATAVYPETTNYRTAFKYEGHLHEFEVTNITLNKCRKCGRIILPNTALDKITEEFRNHINLLTAEQIRSNLQGLQLTQKEFAELIGVAPETVSRWLTNVQIQTRSLDKLMQLFFTSAEVRRLLGRMKDGPLSARAATLWNAARSQDSGHVAAYRIPDRQSQPDYFSSTPRFSRQFSRTVLDHKDRFELVPGRN